MSNALSEEKKQQVIALGKLGWPLRRIEQATGVRRETASAYLKAAGIVVRLPRFWGKRIPAKPANEVTLDSGSKPANEVTPDFNAAFSPKSAIRSACEGYHELIEQGLARGRNGKAIWQDLVSDHGFTGSYQAVKRFVRKLRGPQPPEPAGIILTAPGEEAQVDYGSGPMVRDPQSGKYRRTRLFVLTLGYSRKSVRLLTWRSSVRTWAELHEKAFRRLGGCPKIVVLDNLKEGVAVPDLYDPTINPLFRDVLAHYGVVALPCRIQDPDRKGKVESGIGHTKRTPLKGMRFESLEEAQGHLDRWEERWADTRVHGTTKRQVAAMFLEEKPHLLPLPLEPSTKKAAESHLGAYIIPRLGKLRLDDLGVENQQMFVGYLAERVSRKTVVNVVGTLSSMLNTAKNWGYICEGVSISRLVLPEREVKQQARTFTPEQAKAILELAEDPWRTMFAIAAYAGLRAGEILGLSVEDIDLARGVLNVRKAAWYGKIQTAKSVGSENTIPIPENLAEMLRRFIGDRREGLLFVNKARRPYTSSGKVVQKRLWPLCDALKIPRAGFHAFRHMHATLLLETGATPKVAQRQLRHADSRVILDHYAHLIDSSHREAVERAAAFLDRSGPKLGDR